MRAVIDTNVLASGIFFNCPPHEILRKFNEGSFSLVISHEILGQHIMIQHMVKREARNRNTKVGHPRKIRGSKIAGGMILWEKHFLGTAVYRTLTIIPRKWAHRPRKIHRRSG